MAAATVTLNRRYRSAVRRRALCGADCVNRWRGQHVSVFLRHESDHVFAVAGSDQIGMADFVCLESVSFQVDQAGRRQACRLEGDLPNGRNVHAWVRGTLVWATMHSRLTASAHWKAVIYNPQKMTAFQLRDSGQPVFETQLVVCTPRPAGVWCLPTSSLESAEVAP